MFGLSNIQIDQNRAIAEVVSKVSNPLLQLFLRSTHELTSKRILSLQSLESSYLTISLDLVN